MGFAPVYKPNNSGPVAEIPEISKLHKALMEIDSKPNVLTVEQFRQFAPLFQKHTTLNEEQLEDLGKRYIRAIDFYKKTDIIKGFGDNTVVLSLPAIFTPIRSLPPTPQAGRLVDMNTKMAGHDVPRYATAALAGMVQALVDEQARNRAVVTDYRREYLALQQVFFEKHEGGAGVVKTSAEPQASAAYAAENTTWEFEE